MNKEKGMEGEHKWCQVELTFYIFRYQKLMNISQMANITSFRKVVRFILKDLLLEAYLPL